MFGFRDLCFITSKGTQGPTYVEKKKQGSMADGLQGDPGGEAERIFYLHRFRAFRRPGDRRNKSVRETYVRIRRDTRAEKEGKGQGQRGCKETGEGGAWEIFYLHCFGAVRRQGDIRNESVQET